MKLRRFEIPDERRADLAERLIRNSLTTAKGCWEWQKVRSALGYGQTSSGSDLRGAAHRFAYATFKGPVPAGMVVRHKCDNPPCINPDHLELGTQRDNSQDTTLRGRHPLANRTHCPKGHPYAGKNLGISKQANRGEWNRVCRTCHRDNHRSKTHAIPSGWNKTGCGRGGDQLMAKEGEAPTCHYCALRTAR